MKIVWLAHEGSLSGANRCLLEYLQILKHRGIQNYVIIPYGNGELDLKAGELSIPVKKIKFYSWTKSLYAPPPNISTQFRRWFRNYIAVKKISAFIKKTGPDYVVTNTISTPVAAIAAKKIGIKHLWFVHEFGEEDHGFSIAGGFKRGAVVMDRLSGKLVFNSVAVRKKYQSFVSNSKAFIVHNAVIIPEVALSAFVKKGPLSLIMLGQVAPSKNHLEALHALEICREKGLEFTLDIVGSAVDDKYLHCLKAFVKNKNMDAIIHFSGPAMEPVSLLAQHHALLMCSHHEAFGRVTVEALKCGLPVIAANTGGSLEIIEDGVNGFFYEAGKAAELSKKIMLLDKNYQFFNRKKIGGDARQKYNEANTALQLMSVFVS